MQQTRLIIGIFSSQGTLRYVSDCKGFQTVSKPIFLKVYPCSLHLQEYLIKTEGAIPLRAF